MPFKISKVLSKRINYMHVQAEAGEVADTKSRSSSRSRHGKQQQVGDGAPKA